MTNRCFKKKRQQQQEPTRYRTFTKHGLYVKTVRVKLGSDQSFQVGCLTFAADNLRRITSCQCWAASQILLEAFHRNVKTTFFMQMQEILPLLYKLSSMINKGWLPTFPLWPGSKTLHLQLFSCVMRIQKHLNDYRHSQRLFLKIAGTVDRCVSIMVNF